MAPYSSTLAWRIPGTEEPGGLPSMGSHRVGCAKPRSAFRASGPQPQVLSVIGEVELPRLIQLLRGMRGLQPQPSSSLLCQCHHTTSKSGFFFFYSLQVTSPYLAILSGLCLNLAS